ncbi:Flagellar P-ring protein FlgI [Liberibacter crescens BT-1]|uniref:Flagellar P-ring protein n=1 Tax=Liberibacter crescens (strain BT-1) TaxID=1215343 RepID=L0EUY3_LIBCB|nr:flagellar basal body P-ring protein FlgI [Liberibacter crescens]AGA64196.1 Flagellar P-ring protein FlgI [Liberibacter crescens BT-1]AMC12452.1 flagellar P-ring protein FlgI [Liberibacter crescens]
MRFFVAFFLFFVSGILSVTFAQVFSRIKDVASLQAARSNQLIGYGLVVGLQGSGDSLRLSPFTEQSVRAMLQNLGISTQGGKLGAKNIAAVIVTASLPPFSSPGSRIDVSVNSLGDASSLRGGTLIMTSLLGADGQIYAVAQGSIVVSGVSVKGKKASVFEGITTSGRIINGAIIERALPVKFKNSTNLILQLRNPDFSTSVNIADSINSYASSRFGTKIAEAHDSQEVSILKPKNIEITQLMADIENLPVKTDTPARVVVNERTGTIVIGANVKISKVVVSYGNLTVRINEQQKIVQPSPLSNGITSIQENTDIDVLTSSGPVAFLDGPDLTTLVSGLNRIGLKPDGIIAILQGIKSAGALQSELVLQ